MEKQFDDRTKLLIGEDNLKKLMTKKVAVCGNGGVGSIIPLVLLRSGILDFILVDFDKVDRSNLNRQIAYNLNDVGKLKSEALSLHLKELRKEVNTLVIGKKIDNNFDFSIFDSCSYVFDCIDDIKAKVLLIKYCKSKGIKIISSLGMGNRLNSTEIIITKLIMITIN